MVIVNQEEVIKITANLLGRIHGGIQIELGSFRECRENAGQHAFLDLLGHL